MTTTKNSAKVAEQAGPLHDLPTQSLNGRVAAKWVDDKGQETDSPKWLILSLPGTNPSKILGRPAQAKIDWDSSLTGKGGKVAWTNEEKYKALKTPDAYASGHYDNYKPGNHPFSRMVAGLFAQSVHPDGDLGVYRKEDKWVVLDKYGIETVAPPERAARHSEIDSWMSGEYAVVLDATPVALWSEYVRNLGEPEKQNAAKKAAKAERSAFADLVDADVMLTGRTPRENNTAKELELLSGKTVRFFVADSHERIFGPEETQTEAFRAWAGKTLGRPLSPWAYEVIE
jgi:hypothetical protein